VITNVIYAAVCGAVLVALFGAIFYYTILYHIIEGMSSFAPECQGMVFGLEAENGGSAMLEKWGNVREI
jgi:hypothetical protein